jgi:hypothetical protein
MACCHARLVDALLAGRDYPGTLREFNAWFADDEACLCFLAGLRWPGGFACAGCGGGKAWRMSKGHNLRCARCRLDASVTAGTVFADTRLPLTTWFAAAWYLTGTKHGVSALGLQRLLGLGSYETSLLHNSAARWSGRDATSSWTRSRSTKPLLAPPCQETSDAAPSPTR